MWWNILKDMVELEFSLVKVPFPVKRFPNKDAPKVPNSINKKPPFCSFVSFLIVLLTPFNKIFESSKTLKIFKTSFISTFEIVKVSLFVFKHQ